MTKRKKRKYGSLCTGIGGFDLGFDRAGWECQWQVEIAAYPIKVLEQHWPNVTRFKDVKKCGRKNLTPIDVLSFGFPCKDLSLASKGSHRGLAGKYSGLFFDCARIACELKPDWLVIENVPQVKRYLDLITAKLPMWSLEYADICYADFGLATRRVRTFIVGHPRNRCTEVILDRAKFPRPPTKNKRPTDVLPMCLPWEGGLSLERLGSCVVIGTEADRKRVRTSDGVSRRLDRDRYLALGNSVSPVIAEWIAQRINEVDK